ncbi:unnamed protein product [Clonostachys solani]|uniref:Uncharacterized protein n=1 Tax=Clonostachys solani TaxID=160281 RepID=A0A9N9ZGK3_9HYPO|nr:unnamed protein product [Clonostachys solani]
MSESRFKHHMCIEGAKFGVNNVRVLLEDLEKEIDCTWKYTPRNKVYLLSTTKPFSLDLTRRDDGTSATLISVQYVYL